MDWDSETFIEYVPEMIKNFGKVYQVRDKKTGKSIAFVGISDGSKNGFMQRNSFFEVTGM